MVYISVILHNTYHKLPAGPLRAAFMYCIHLLSYDLWALCPQSVESSDHINIEHVYSGYILPQAGFEAEVKLVLKLAAALPPSWMEKQFIR